MKDLTGFGAINIDHIFRISKFPESGTESTCKKIGEFQGGSGLNTCVNLGKIGYNVGYVGAIGEESKILEDSFEWIDREGVKVKESETGKTICFIDQNGERTIFIDSGANNELKLKDISKEYLFDSKYVLISSFADEKQFHIQRQLIDGIPDQISLIFSLGHLYAKRGLSELRNFIERANFLFLNEDEAELLTGKSFEKASEDLVDLGSDNVIVTRGKNGSFIRNKEFSEFISIESSSAVDTTGAGDSFISGFILGLLKGKNIVECMNLGNKMAKASIKSHGAIVGIKDVSEELICDGS